MTENLEAFLRAYTRSWWPAPSRVEGRIGFWIDALCINQNDIDERNEQVKRMRDMYKQAFITLIWLGQGADDSDQAIDLLDSIAQYPFDLWDDGAFA